METISILISKISGLSKEEQSKVYDHLNRLLEEPSSREHALLKIGNELHEREAIGCPSCKSEQWVKFGKYNHLQKYRCKSCGRTFTSMTGTSAHRIHDKQNIKQTN